MGVFNGDKRSWRVSKICGSGQSTDLCVTNGEEAKSVVILIRLEDELMTEGDAGAGAVRETTVFVSHFEDLPDYLQKGKVVYPLDEVLL